MVTMAAAIALRSDFAGPDLRRLARRAQDARQAGRLLALATIYDGGSRSDDDPRDHEPGGHDIIKRVAQIGIENPASVLRHKPGALTQIIEDQTNFYIDPGIADISTAAVTEVAIQCFRPGGT